MRTTTTTTSYSSFDGISFSRSMMLLVLLLISCKSPHTLALAAWTKPTCIRQNRQYRSSSKPSSSSRMLSHSLSGLSLFRQKNNRHLSGLTQQSKHITFTTAFSVALQSNNNNIDNNNDGGGGGGAGGAVNSITLNGLLDDHHDEEAERLAKSVTAWLDAEWMPQQVHVDMASSVAKSYIQCRTTLGEHDLMAIMMVIANDLEQSWKLYDKDAFCNAYDIANYVADYLTSRAGLETCSCSHRIY